MLYYDTDLRPTCRLPTQRKSLNDRPRKSNLVPSGRPKEEKANPKAAKTVKSAEAKRNGNGANLGFEAQMFLAADKLRKNLEPSDYKHVALGLIFLKHISRSFEAN